MKKIAFYGLASFIVLNLIAFISLYFLGKSCFYKQQFIHNGVKETNFDYVVLGSSTGLTTLDTKLIDSLTGKKGLNISIDDSGLSSHYLMLQQFYFSGKRTKKLILAVMPDDLENENPKLNGNDYRFLPHINEDDVKTYFNEIDGENKIIYQTSKYMPLLAVSYFNTELFFPAVLSIFQPQKRNLFDEKGNYSYPNVNSSKKLKRVIGRIKKIDFKNPYLNKIIDFCKVNRVNLILYQSPIYKTEIVFPDGLNCINQGSVFNDIHFFYDEIHVNKRGRKICSEEFAKNSFFLN
ncbi:hypothetical protein [Flavobacterium sp.]|uniref:hypothetical protein n=1 Tax=Flavobacterium sp. TaxID=239 RepID=UPI0035276D62